MWKSTWVRCGRLAVVLLIALIFATVASSAGAPGAYAAQALAPAVAPLAPPAQAVAPADTPGGAAVIDCNDPIPGQKAMLIGEDEVALVYHTNNHPALNDVYWDSSGSNLVYAGGSYRSSISALQSNSWATVTWGDLNGDDEYEYISAFKDKSKRVGAITNKTSTEWYNANAVWEGDNIAYLDIAAGNLDRANNDDEVVIAFRDDNKDIHVGVLNGNSSGGIAQAANALYGEWTDSTNNRGEVNHVAVATGDLDGDGYDDEIVVVFKDSASDLQAMVLRRDGATLTPLWLSGGMTAEGRGDVAKSESLWGNRYPIDVTTGDIDGDKRDEAIVGFRLGDPSNGSSQLLVLKYTGQDTKGNTDPFDDRYSMDTRVFLTENLGDKYGHYSMAALSVSLATGDIDSDGIDEIAFGIGSLLINGEHDSRIWETYLATYDYVPMTSPDWQSMQCKDTQGYRDCLRYLHYWKSGGTSIDIFENEQQPEGDVRIAAGELDGDGKDEIVLLRKKHSSDDGEIYAFDAETGVSKRSMAVFSPEADVIDTFWVAMGDKDEDARYGAYTGACRVKKQAQVNAVIHAPPHWPEEEVPGHPGEINPNWDEAEAASGMKTGAGGGTGQTTETSVGASVSLAPELPLEEAPINIGPSFTYEWEKATSLEQKTTTEGVDGNRFITHVPWQFGAEEAYFDAVGFVETVYWCYDYTEASYGLMTVCVPRPEGEMTALNASLEWWYGDGADEGRATYADSWVPVGVNLAQGRTATQSSLWDVGAPERAVDGNTNGNYYEGSVQHTAYQQYAWWEVDLGGPQAIDAIQIWNRTDCCAERTTNFYVFVSEHPFTSTIPSELVNAPGVWSHHVTGQAGRPTVVAVGHEARYVRVQLAGTNNLHLAEVQVYGVPGAVDQWPTTRPITSTTSAFTLVWPSGRQQTVNGQVLYTRKGTQLGLRPGLGGQDFDMGLAQEGEQVTEDSTAKSFALGMELKPAGGGERSWGSTDKTSYVLSWKSELEFSGAVGGLSHYESVDRSYAFMPYVWLQRITSSGGVNQAFLVLDYWVSDQGPVAAAAMSVAPDAPSGPAVTPAAPLIDSPTHPNPAVWVAGSAATFTWAQPPGDVTELSGYRWYLDQAADTTPATVSPQMTTTYTYADLADGVWTMHLHARSTGGQWSPVAHRTIRVDANPPTVTITLDPAAPTGHNGWYVTPVTVAVAAGDGSGSGVAAIEVSTDNVAWVPYNGPAAFTGDTAGTTVYARARDGVGHVSDVVSTTFQIDRTAPDSHVVGGDGPGALIARIITGPQGNQGLLLAGQVADAGAGRAGMRLGIDGLDWTAASQIGEWQPMAPAPGLPPVQVNWVFTATHKLGAGNHIFTGQANDAAGNVEAAYEIARVLWPPTATPNLVGSSLTVTPAILRPGEVAAFTVVARNGGFQEAHVAMTVTLPAGLTPVTATLPSDMTYDPAGRTLTWEAPTMLWPGQWAQRSFEVQAAAGLPAGSLATTAAFHAFWPTAGLTPEQSQPFHDREQTVAATATVAIDPALPAGADVTPPWVHVTRLSGQVVNASQAALAIAADADARWMFLREWAPDPTTGVWAAVQNSGWLDFQPFYTPTLSAGQGVKYIGVWVRDAAGNVSTLDEGSLVFVNRIDGSQALADGQRVQYRGAVKQNAWVVAVLTTLIGDPDMYIWEPYNGFQPDHFVNDSVAPGQTESAGGKLAEPTGLALLEVQAVGASEYQLALAQDAAAPPPAARTTVKPRPQHPLVIADPLSAGVAGTPDGAPAFRLHLPLLLRGQ
jgi:hypothetical protein